MSSKISLKWSVPIIGIVGAAFCLVIISSINNVPSVPSSYMDTVKPARVMASATPGGLGVPIRIWIPKINVDAALESVGLTPSGAMGVPTGPLNAAWYDLGPRPGDAGSAVIDGHFGWWRNGTPAVFDNLDKLRQGDKFYVEDAAGATVAFVVRESRKFDPMADASEVFNSTDGKAHLNLITCDGVWDSVQKSYSDRLVVFADREAE